MVAPIVRKSFRSVPVHPRYIGLNNQRIQMKGSPDRIQSCTSTYFDGIIALIDPETSWVGRWQRTCESPFATPWVAWTVILTVNQLGMCAECMPYGSRVESPKM